MDARTTQGIDPSAAAHEDHGEQVDLTGLPSIRTRTLALAALLAVFAFAALFVLGWLPRRARLLALESKTAQQDSRPIVDTVRPKEGAKSAELRLPAEIRSMQETSLFTRANGYLKRILVDIGDHVEAGALVAEIDTPDVDADLVRARANVELARAGVSKAKEDQALAEKTLDRYVNQGDAGGVTLQQIDERRSASKQAQAAREAAEAGLGVAEAEVGRLSVLQGFERIVAPFSGTITARNYDVGALLTPGNVTEGREIYRIDRTDALRVFVHVPQAYSTAIHVGEDAVLTVPNWVGREFVGKIARTAGSIDASTRTLRVEVDVSNQDGALYSGMYGEVRLSLQTEHSSLLVPTSSLVFVADGTWVWVLEKDHAHHRRVTVGRDFGTELEVPTGLTGDETVVKNPGERLVEGVEVRVASDGKSEKAEAAPRPK